MIHFVVYGGSPASQAALLTLAGQYFPKHNHAFTHTVYAEGTTVADMLHSSANEYTVFCIVEQSQDAEKNLLSAIEKCAQQVEVILVHPSGVCSSRRTCTLTEPWSADEGEDVLETALARLWMLYSQKIVGKLIGGGIRVLDVRDVIAVQSRIHFQNIFLRDGSHVEIRKSLVALKRELDVKLPGCFVYASKGVLVNQNDIDEINVNQISIKGHAFPLAKREFRRFQQQLIQYWVHHDGTL